MELESTESDTTSLGELPKTNKNEWIKMWLQNQPNITIKRLGAVELTSADCMSSELDTLTKGDLKSQLGGMGPNMTSSPNQAFQQESTESTWQSHGTPRWEFEESA